MYPPATISIGRDETQCDVVIAEPSVSRVHATITWDAGTGQYLLHHAGSQSPLSIEGGGPVLPGVPQPVQYGMRICIGRKAIVTIDEALMAKLVAPTTFRGPYYPQVRFASAAIAQIEAPMRAAKVPHSTPTGSPLRVGRDPSNDIVIDAPQVSRFHALLWLLPEHPGSFAFEVAKNPQTGELPSNGIGVGAPHPHVARGVVGPNDVLYLGSYRIPAFQLARHVERYLEHAAPSGPVAQSTSGSATTSLSLPAHGTVILGRDKDVAQLVLDSPKVSRRHAEVEIRSQNDLRIRDLGSANGTFVNGVRISGWTSVGPTDRVSLGQIHLTLVPGQPVRRTVYHGNIRLEARSVDIVVPDKKAKGGTKTLVNGVSLTIMPSELVGLMGPSGAGKTTFLKALNGYSPPTNNDGVVLVNSDNLYERYAEWQHDIGYLPQDDIVFPQLTVEESLRFTARLRLPPDTSRAEIQSRIDALIQRLDLESTRHVKIGDAIDKGISGGQRKRVNLAQELLSDPSILFLDEPTSGLASGDTLQVMKLLRELADDGKTVLLTIHQPALAAYQLMDNVVYLFQGSLIYYGPTHPDSILFLNREAAAQGPTSALCADPGQALAEIELEMRTASEQKQPLAPLVSQRRDAYQRSAYYRDYVQERADGRGGTVQTRKVQKRRPKRGFFHQLGVLIHRLVTVQRKDGTNTSILLAQAPIIAAVMVLVFGRHLMDDPTLFERNDHTPGALFMMVAASIWFGCSNAARAIVGEQAIYLRERMVNLRIDSYVLSKFIVLGALSAVQCFLLLGLTYPALSLQGSFLHLFAVLWLTAMVGVAMGLTVSATVRSGEAAVALVPILLIPQILLGGVLVPADSFSKPVRVLASVMASRWAYEAMLNEELGDQDVHAWFDACNTAEGTSGPAPDAATLTCELRGWPDGDPHYTLVAYQEVSPGIPGTTSPRRASLWVGCGDQRREERARVLSSVPEQLHAANPPVHTYQDLPSRNAACMQVCPALQNASALTPVERGFGVTSSTSWRSCAETDLADLRSEYRTIPDRTAWRVHHEARPALHRLLGALGALALVFGLLVGGILIYRDPIPGDEQ